MFWGFLVPKKALRVLREWVSPESWWLLMLCWKLAESMVEDMVEQPNLTLLRTCRSPWSSVDVGCNCWS